MEIKDIIRHKKLKIVATIFIVLLSNSYGLAQGQSPSAVVKAYYDAIISGNYGEAIKYLSDYATTLAYPPKTLLLNQRVKINIAKKERNIQNNLTRIEIVTEEIAEGGEEARVACKGYFKGAYEPALVYISLIKEDGKWKKPNGYLSDADLSE